MDSARIVLRQMDVDTKAFAVPILINIIKTVSYRLEHVKKPVRGGINEDSMR
jgi:hypothetical protein